MTGRFIGHRGYREDEWSWEQTAPEPPPRGDRRVLRSVVGLLAGVIAVATGIGLIAFFAADSGGNGSTVLPMTPTRSPVATAPPAGTQTPGTGTPAAGSPTPAQTPGPSMHLAIWSKTISEWVFDDLTPETSGYVEGESVPFMLWLRNVEPGDTFETEIKYNCRVDRVATFDYLTGFRAMGDGPATSEAGPARPQPDAAMAVPDDPSLDFDNTNERRLDLWGATFATSIEGPSPPTECLDAKSVSLTILARRQQVYLISGAHLASEQNWGAGGGAASATDPFSVTVSVKGLGSISVALPPGSVASP